MPYMGGPLYWNSDLTVMKNFKIKERQNVEFRVSAFNFMNVGLLSFAPSDNNLSLAINDMGQVITGAKNPADATHPTPWACPLTGAACTGTSTFGVATHHVGNRVMSFGVRYSF
jgi:hypothetical protein